MLSEVFILSMTGESLIWKRYRPNLPKNSPEIFFQRVKENKSPPLPPYIVDNGIHYFHIKRQGVLFVASTKADMLPMFVIELLTRVYHICKDFCGVVSEESIKSNLVLVYELLDELMDFGVVQLGSTEKLKPYIQSEPVAVQMELPAEVLAPSLFGIEQRIAPSNAANKPVIRSRWDKEMRRNEIFVDVIERMTVLIASNGSVVRCEVSGQVNMKSFLGGCPEIKLGLNEDLTIGREAGRKGYGTMAHLDDCHFHECVKMDEFEETRMLVIRPPEGEFAVMTYHLSGDLPHSLPFQVMSYVNDSESTRDLEVGLKLRCEIPSSSHAVNVKVNLPVPATTTGISQKLSGPGQSAELVSAQKKVVWTIKKIHGKSEVSAHFKLILSGDSKTKKLELAPVALDFEISGFVCSSLQIRFLRVFDREHSYVPLRWLRYVTVTDSYICKLSS